MSRVFILGGTCCLLNNLPTEDEITTIVFLYIRSEIITSVTKKGAVVTKSGIQAAKTGTKTTK